MEIGNTPCIRLPFYEEELNFDGVWIKDESKNPTGTFKDRKSRLVLQKARVQGAEKIVLISMGNAANSLAKLSAGAGIKVCTVVDKNLTPDIRAKLRDVCHRVHETDLHSRLITSEELKNMVRESAEEKILDATNEFHGAYAEIVHELRQQLPVIPDAIFMPFGSGEAMTGVLQGVSDVGWTMQTSVIGIHDPGVERLRTKYFHVAYADCLRPALLPSRLVLEISTDLTREQIQAVVPEEVQAEDAAAIVFAYVVANAHNLPLVKRPRNIVVVNSGCGEIIR